jgi:hypothetical protein
VQRQRGIDIAEQNRVENGLGVSRANSALFYTSLMRLMLRQCTFQTRPAQTTHLGCVPLQRSTGPNQLLPPALVRRYEVFIKPRSDAKQPRMREVQSASIGHLVTVRVRVETPGPLQPDMLQDQLANMMAWLVQEHCLFLAWAS